MIYSLMSGALMMSCLTTGFFFLRFWKKTHDRLFFIFGLAFFMLSLERLVLGFIGTRWEPNPAIYLIRLSAFILIVIAIVDKNRSKSEV